MNHLRYILDAIELIGKRDASRNNYPITPLQELMEFRTIHVGGVRQSGKTKSLIEIAKQCPSVYIGYKDEIKYVTEIGNDLKVSSSNLQDLMKIKIIPTFVLIDDASVVFNQIKAVKVYKKILEAFGEDIVVIAMH